MSVPDSPTPPEPSPDGTFLHATRLALGLTDLAVRTAARAGGVRVRERHPTAAAASDAALGLALEAQHRLSSALLGAAERTAPATRAAVRGLVPSGATDAVGRRVAHWSARGAAERLRARNEALSAARRLVQVLAAAVLDEIDLDAVADRLDVDRVASRLDVDRVASRIDIDAVLARVDLVTYTELVLEEMDIGRVVRDTGGSITAETLDAFREQNARADRLVQRIADRLLRRAGTDSTNRPAAGPVRQVEAL
ncbi:hypothetical protein [Streptomyces griseorubiginosus]|uniref:hypothetical protein n=1 Tax=Streptomyces griseorubiginosus TaxID=67304 RepID=UPI001AD7480F|nr:hypothetical protein [Streptomyces griseorubiginosus]MBO4253941.1 hypothetical protein [Streptomyces griseorubiginosus]